MTRLTIALCLLVSIQTSAQYTVDTVPNQREINGSMVTNPDGILSDGGVTALDTLLADIENKTTAQVAVVAIESIGDADLFDFAQSLFNTWGIGHKNDNGVLVLLVTDQRTIRIHTGKGIEGILTDVTCKRIQRDYMVPSFKEGDYEAGIIAGVQRIREILIDPSKAEELTYVDDSMEFGEYEGWMILLGVVYGFPFLLVWGTKGLMGSFSNSKKRKKTAYPALMLTQAAWAIEFGLIPLVIVLAYWPGDPTDAVGLCLLTLYLYFMATLVHRLVRERRVLKQFVDNARYYEATVFIGSTMWYWFFMALLFPIPFVVYFIFHLTRKSHYRNHPRKCKLCQAEMKKLSEKDEDQFLDDKQQLEENIASADYDVWLCPNCKATREWQYPRKEKYTPCPSCKTKAYYRVSRRTVVSATYTSAGEGKEVYECKYCHETKTVPYKIPRLVATSSSSSSSGGSSSSSGSSFGGGSSGGGGASSSW